MFSVLLINFSGNLLRSLQIQIRQHHMCSFAHETACRRTADSACPTRNKSDFARKFSFCRSQGKLIQLQRPVFDVIRFVLAKGDELTERRSPAHNRNRPVIQSCAYFGVAPALAGIDHADARNQNDARSRFKHNVAFVFIPLEVSLVLLFVISNAIDQFFPQPLNVVHIRRPIDEEWNDLRMDEVIRAGRADLRQFCGILAAGKGQHIVSIVIGKNHFLSITYRAANRRH
ncbi:hypothetical protein D3C77_364790 [compost metagenome]